MGALTTLFEFEATTNFNWTDSQALNISQLSNRLGMEVLRPVFRAGRRELQASQYVGTVRIRKDTIQVLPKIYRSDDRSVDVSREATANLLYLLSYAGQFGIRESDIMSLTRQTSDWFEILTRLFAMHLLKEWQRGAARNYEEVENELPVLKGRWRLNEQLRRPALKQKFSVTFDEFTPDNRLNRVFRFVTERLWRLTLDSENRRLLGDLRMLLDEVTLLPRVTAADAAPSLVSRMNSRFLPLLNLARLFLDGGAIQQSAGNTDSFAFVFDMNALFEHFLIGFVRRHRLAVLSSELQACRYLPQTKGATRFLAFHEQKQVFQLKPDLAFEDTDSNFPLLVDAKYKGLSEQDRRRGVAQSDFYQMHAYAQRYQCRRVVLVYPQTSRLQNRIRAKFRLQNKNNDVDVLIEAATIDLRLNLSQSSERLKLIDELREVFTPAN